MHNTENEGKKKAVLAGSGDPNFTCVALTQGGNLFLLDSYISQEEESGVWGSKLFKATYKFLENENFRRNINCPTNLFLK